MHTSPRSLLPMCLLTALLHAATLSRAAAGTFTVTTDTDSGPGSLRQAILDANAAPGSDIIRCTIPSSGAPPVINVTGTLPDITGPLTMRDDSMEIRSTGMTAGQSLITITGGNSTVGQVSVVSTTAGTVGITLSGNGGNTVENAWIGISYANLIPSAGLHGIVITSDDNIISGSRIGGASGGDGVRITGNRNTVKGSFIGVNPALAPEQAMAPNRTGIHLLGGADNVIGRPLGDTTPFGNNQISASLETGIHVEGGQNHRVRENEVSPFGFSSTTRNGTGTSGHGILIDSQADGILVEATRISSTNGANLRITGGAKNITISGKNSEISMAWQCIAIGETGSVTVEDYRIFSSGGSGIHLEGGSGKSGPILIRNNQIAANPTGIHVVSGMGQVTIGTRKNPTDAVSNVISGNYSANVLITDPSATVRVTENAIHPIARAGPFTPYLSTLAINLQPAGEPSGTATPNDPLDADTGPNGLQNKPVIHAIVPLTGDAIRVEAILRAKPSTTYTVEAHQYAPTMVEPKALFMATATVTTDISGNAAISLPLTAYRSGWKVALTATSPEGETSEYSNAEPAGFVAPEFPLLTDQSSLSFPEANADAGASYTLVRPTGLAGAFDATLSILPEFITAPSGQSALIILRYRLNPADPWINVGNLGTTFTVPFAATDNSKNIHFSSKDDNGWDPTGKPSKLTVTMGGISKQIPVLSPDNDPPPVFTATNDPEFVSPPFPGMPVPPPGFFEDSITDRTRIRLIADRTVSTYISYQITFNAVQSTAVYGQDLTIPSYGVAVPFTTSIFEGSLSTSSFGVSPINDALVEGDEIISFNIVSTTAGFPYSAVVPLTLKDNDFHQAFITDASVAEGNSGTTLLAFPVTIGQALPTDVTFDWTTAAGIATPGTDFIAASGTVTIPAGSTSASIQVTVTGDALIEPTETFTVTLAHPSNPAVVLSRATATGTITNDDFAMVSVSDRTVSESAGTISFTATLSEPVPFASSVAYTVANGTASRPGDYTVTSPSGTLNFPAGSTTAFISFSIVNDTVVEPDETFTLQLSNASNLNLGTSSAIITIQDNDSPTLLTPTVVSMVEGDTGTQPLSISLVLSTAALRAGSLDWQVTADSTGVEAASGTVTFAPGATTANLGLAIAGNLIPQSTRSVKLQLSSPVEVSLPASMVTVATITDNDQRAITGNAVSLAEGNGGTSIALFPVSISTPLEVPVTVQYQTADGSALTGTDYMAANGTATIPAGATEVTIPITVLADTTLELTETFTVLLSSPVNATLATANLTGTIQNDDDQPVLQISPATVTAGPGGPFMAWIEIKLPEASSSLGFPVAYAVATRNGSALAGTDYTPITGGVLTFPPGNGTPASLWITVTVAGNQNAGGGPTQFHVDFTPLTGPASILSTEVKIEPLRVTAFSRIGLGFYTVSFPTGIAQNYVIQQATSLAGPWSDKTSVIPGTGNPVDEFLLFASQPRAYFRVRSFTTPPATPANLGRNP